MSALDWDDLLLVGRVARTHGLRGEVAIDVVSDFADERFRVGRTVYRLTPQGPGRLAIASVRRHHDRLLVRFDDVASIESAEALGKTELRMRREDAGRLPDGTFHHHDLVGCEVWTTDGILVGEVGAVDGTRTMSRLVVRGPRGDVLVPLVDRFCVEIDVGARRIVIDPPEGLLDLNA